MYKELDKYKSGNTNDGIGVLPDGQEIKIKYDEYVFKLGDLLNDFNIHQNKRFWQKKYYHNHLTKLYIKMLNEVVIKANM